jgi:glycosyltransferase involved in cell wall biosynthesis
VQRSLSVLVPVKNAQSTLLDSVHEILDEMADSGDRFEVLIIDDGSTDATSEVAHELARHYPQIRLIRHGRSRGRDAAIRSGMERSQGQVIMLHNDESGFSTLERSWRPMSAVSSRPARPNYLRRVRDFALGE